MVGGLDLAGAYEQSGPALLGVLNILVVIAWYDFRAKISEAKEKAADAVSEASEAKDQAAAAARKNDRQEILIDQVATGVEDVERAVGRNDERIRRIQQNQAAAHGGDFQSSGTGRSRNSGPADDAQPNESGGQ